MCEEELKMKNKKAKGPFWHVLLREIPISWERCLLFKLYLFKNLLLNSQKLTWSMDTYVCKLLVYLWSLRYIKSMKKMNWSWPFFSSWWRARGPSRRGWCPCSSHGPTHGNLGHWLSVRFLLYKYCKHVWDVEICFGLCIFCLCSLLSYNYKCHM